jgi:quercetin dioxygenase-like cupin family protein
MFKIVSPNVLMAGALIILFAPLVFRHQQPPDRPIPKVIQLDPKGKDYLRILAGPPETSTMRSGLITLAPGKSVGKHSTENFEELVIILEGQAEMRITDGEVLRLAKGFAAYCPSDTEHDVLNIGSDALRYIYIVAEARR